MLAIQKQLSNWFYALLSLPATGMGFALSVQISALSWILTTQYGLKIDEVGFVWLSGPLAGIIGQLAVGSVSDNTWFGSLYVVVFAQSRQNCHGFGHCQHDGGRFGSCVNPRFGNQRKF